ncbi:MAG: hypothetical protein A2Y33_02190 [Spirochaetes bacterium GWF1_51_8]|nr:MAG: hypothetical protein A2Y33_02190 [Spirochaetes bacterium GWF1_51_8]
MKKIKIPDSVRKEWTWNGASWEGGYRYDGVHLFEGCLVWYTEYYPGWSGGGTCQQSVEDFLTNGPSVGGAPEDVLEELRAILKPVYEKSLKGSSKNLKQFL